MRVAITGASGFVGRALAEALRARGDEPVAARRSGDAALRWSTADGFTPSNALSGFDAVVHLAGENIASGRWTDARKARIKASRVEGTRRVVEALKAADPRPATLVSISAVGYYGTPGGTELDEDAPAGTDFLADVCAAWEAEAVEAEALGVRVARLRLGTVLGVGGGALGKMLPAFKLGVGGRLGDGDQYMSWVHLEDVVRAILYVLDDANCSGPYNVTAPTPVPNRDFTKTLGKVLGRPTVLPVPKFALRAAFGEMADHILLQGQRVVPTRLRAAGFAFEHAELEAALTDALG
ncbi:MAG: TIGR01777 family oxidoreductase [Myxococcota bacterium]